MLTGRMLFLANGETKESDDGLVWKTAIRTGRWEISPGAGGPTAKPLIFVPGRSADPQTAIGLQDIVDNFDAGAVEHVTVPKSHLDNVDENTGYVEKLKIEPQPDGSHHLMAGIRFTEPDIKDKVLRGSIANSSVGLKFNYQRKEDGRMFPIALDHLALTNKPWLNKLTPFGLSEKEEKEAEVAFMNFSDPSTEPQASDETPIVVEPVFEVDGLKLYPRHMDAIQKYFSDKNSVSSSEATLEDDKNTDPNKENTVDPKQPAQGTPKQPEAEQTPAPVQLSDDAIKAALKPISDQNAVLLAEVARLRKREREADVAVEISKLRDMGLSEENGFTGFLKEAETIMLSDEGQKVLTLSEGEGQVELSAGDIVQRLISKFPTDENTGKLKLALSEQTIDPLRQHAGDKPPVTDPNHPDPSTVQLSDEEREKHFDELFERLNKNGGGVAL